MKEIEIPDGVPEETYLSVPRAFFGADPDSDRPSNGLLQGLLEAPVFFRHAVAVAFQAGRESAYTTDEWRAVFDAVDGPRNWFQPVDDETIAEKVLADCRKYYEDAYLQRRRTGATDWEKVADA